MLSDGMNLAERLSAYAQSISYADLGEDAVQAAKQRILDSLGCAIGAFGEPPVKIARRVVESSHSNGASSILGTETKTSPDMATFVNGLMVRYFDYNDTYLSKEPAHPSDNLASCLAVGEREDASGKDLLTALALAYEIQCRLCDAADIRHRGWDHVCYGLVSSALAAGKLMCLTTQKLTQAVNISLNGHIAMRQVRAGEISEWKGASFANAARNAVFSSMLAARGMTGPSPIFEGEMGFFNQVSGPFELNTESFGGAGRPFKLVETYVKYFPAEYHSQSAIWAALQARSKIQTTGDIVSVDVETHEAGYNILGRGKEKWAPSTRETADHSLPFIVAMALLNGRVDNSSYSPGNLRNPRVRSFMKRIDVREDRTLTEAYPRHISNRVTLRLNDGRTVTEQVDDPKGHPNNPMTKDEVEAKFRRLTSRFLSESAVRDIADFVWSLEKQRHAGALAEICVVS